MTRRLALALALASALSSSCGSKKPAGAPVGVSDKPGMPAPGDRPVEFVLDSLDGRPVSSDSTRGKPTVLAFVTTGDILGQAQVDYLVAMSKHDKGQVNYALVALHPRREAVLVETYAKTLAVEFPVALAEAANVAGPSGPFGEIPAVPTVIVLDRAGRIAWKHTGLAKSDELRARLRGL